MIYPAVSPPDAPFQPRQYHWAEVERTDPTSDEWSEEFAEECQCPWVFHGWDGCQNGLPEVPEWVNGHMVCEACETRHV